jgi:hypothetical protein
VRVDPAGGRPGGSPVGALAAAGGIGVLAVAGALTARRRRGSSAG